MKWFLLLTILLAVSNSKAEVSPEHVEIMLAQMVKENVISAPEAEKAKIRMRSLSKDQWSSLNKQANIVASRTPASVTESNNKIEEVHGIDLDGQQFKEIQNEVRKIVPQYQD